MASKPPYDGRVEYYAHAYSLLSTDRALGYGCIGPIPHRSMRDWCDDSGFDDDQRNTFVTVIALVDAETQRRQNVRLKNPNAAPPARKD